MQGHRVAKDGDSEVWVKPLAGGGTGGAAVQPRRRAGDNPRHRRAARLPRKLRARVRDLWAHKDLPRWSGSIEATVEPHSIAMFRIEP